MNLRKLENNFNLIPVSGLLLGLSWPPSQNYLLIFVALVPLLHVLNQKYYSIKKIFLISFINFLTFALISLYWIYNAGQEFGIFVSTALLTSLSVSVATLMSAATCIIYYISKALKLKILGYLSIVVGWLSYEYLTFTWDLHFPWLTLGNGLAIKHQIIQWYEFTGVIGGSLWILLVNIAIYEIYMSIYKTTRTIIIKIITLSIIVIIPIYVSVHSYNNYTSDFSNTIDVAIVQPNLDPYKKKFNRHIMDENLTNTIKLTKSIINKNTKLIIWPETMLFDPISENNISYNKTINYLKQELLHSPSVSLLTGITTTTNSNNDYNLYNSAILITDDNTSIQIYHKNKLVPFIESMPYPRLLKIISEFLPTWGAANFYKATNDGTLFNIANNVHVTAAICYDSIFGGTIASRVNNGANLIAIITNDAWWKDTDGYKQHALYAKLLAISNRRSIARSANTGISEFINERGDIIHATKWDEAIAINTQLTLNNNKTFYSKHGDYIAIISIYIFALLLLITTIYKLYICKI